MVTPRRPKTFNVAYLDGDEIVYNAGFASQHKWYYIFCLGDDTSSEDWVAKFKYKKEAIEYCNTWLDGVHDPAKDLGWGVIQPKVEYDSEAIARYNADAYIKAIKKALNAKEIVLAFSSPTNFRNDIATIQVYKGSRLTAPKPFHYTEIKKHLILNYNVEMIKEYEADDVLGIQGMNAYNGGLDRVIVTNDKDLNMIPGWRYYPNKKALVWITPQVASDSLFLQWLTGDSTDDIPGLYKVTGKKALAKTKRWVLEGETDYDRYCRVWTTYWENSDLSEEETTDVVNEIGRLLWMKRSKSQDCFLSFINTTCPMTELEVK